MGQVTKTADPLTRCGDVLGKFMNDNVIQAQFGGSPFPLLADVEAAIWDAVMEYQDRVPLMGVVGVLRLIEHRLLSEAHS